MGKDMTFAWLSDMQMVFGVWKCQASHQSTKALSLLAGLLKMVCYITFTGSE